MEVCDNGHNEIVYLSRECQLCKAIDELNKSYEKIEQLEDEILNLTEQQE